MGSNKLHQHKGEMMHGYDFFYGHMGVFSHLSFWILIIILALVIYILNSRKSTSEDEPIKILKIRLAKGEITKAEFDKLMEKIE